MKKCYISYQKKTYFLQYLNKIRRLVKCRIFGKITRKSKVSRCNFQVYEKNTTSIFDISFKDNSFVFFGRV